MKLLARICKALALDERGLETIEYAVMSGLITASVLITVGTIGAWIACRFGLVKVTLGA